MIQKLFACKMEKSNVELENNMNIDLNTGLDLFQYIYTSHRNSAWFHSKHLHKQSIKLTIGNSSNIYKSLL